MNCEINENKSIIDYKKSLDHSLMMKYIDIFLTRYPFLEMIDLGCSFMGKRIPVIVLGRGESSAVYVGAERGGDWITSIILLRFINEYCELYKRKGRIYNNTLEALYSSKTVYVVPMLDPDGVDYAINGIPDKNMLYDRLCKDDGCFDTEARALCNFLRFNPSVKALLSLYLGREGIHRIGGNNSSRALTIAHSISRMTGYSLRASNEAHLTEPCMSEIDIPAFAVKCGDEKKCFNADVLFRIYSDIREALFGAPLMI